MSIGGDEASFKIILGVIGVVLLLVVGFKVIDYNLRPSSIE